MASIENLLELSGLTDKESRVYLAALELGTASILRIAQKSGVKRSTVYEIVPQLEKRGMVVKTKDGKKNSYVAENPKTVLSLLKEKEKRFQEAMPEMMGLYKSQENRPKVFFYEGKAEVMQMYEDTLREAKPILNYTSIHNLYQFLDKAWVEDYIDRRLKAKIPTKIIALDTPEAREWEQTSEKELREIKFLAGKIDFSADVHIYGNKVIITTYKQDIFGLLIEDENISKMQRLIFDNLWQAL